jgi:hypothetical protein
VRGKMTSDISITGAVAPVALDLSTAVSGLSQDRNSGDIRGSIPDRTAGRQCRGDRRSEIRVRASPRSWQPIRWIFTTVSQWPGGSRKGRIIKRCLYYALGVAALGGMLCSPGYLSAAETKDSPSSTPFTVSAFIAKNCVAGHHPPNPALGIDLTTLTFNLNDVDTYRRWVRIHDAVRNGKMPPGGKSLQGAGSRSFRNSDCGVQSAPRCQGALFLDI